jgi:hypothetical protein
MTTAMEQHRKSFGLFANKPVPHLYYLIEPTYTFSTK